MTVAPEIPAACSAASASDLLAGVYRRLADTCEALTVRVAETRSTAGRAWVDGAELAENPKALDAFVDAEAARIHDRHGHTARRGVAASRALHDYVWSVSLLMSGAWYLERRVRGSARGTYGWN